MKSTGEHSLRPIPKTATSMASPSQTVRAAGGPDRTVQAKRQHAIDMSPRQSAQRKRLEHSFDHPLEKKYNPTGIPDEIKATMEDHFNTGFSNIRVHAGSTKASELNALAYTQGSEIHFAPGHYQPDTAQGKQLLGHELTHVVQQRQGRVAPTGQVGGMPLNDNPALEKEADVMGEKVK